MKKNRAAEIRLNEVREATLERCNELALHHIEEALRLIAEGKEAMNDHDKARQDILSSRTKAESNRRYRSYQSEQQLQGWVNAIRRTAREAYDERVVPGFAALRRAHPRRVSEADLSDVEAVMGKIDQLNAGFGPARGREFCLQPLNKKFEPLYDELERAVRILWAKSGHPEKLPETKSRSQPG